MRLRPPCREAPLWAFCFVYRAAEQLHHTTARGGGVAARGRWIPPIHCLLQQPPAGAGFGAGSGSIRRGFSRKRETSQSHASALATTGFRGSTRRSLLPLEQASNLQVGWASPRAWIVRYACSTCAATLVLPTVTAQRGGRGPLEVPGRTAGGRAHRRGWSSGTRFDTSCAPGCRPGARRTGRAA